MSIRRSLLQHLPLCLLLCALPPLAALDFTLRPGAFVFFPAGRGNITDSGVPRYSLGGGGDLGIEMDLAGIFPNALGLGYSLGLEAALQFNSLRSPASGNVQFYSAGGGAGLGFFPLARLLTRVDGAAGVYQSVIPGEFKSAPGLWWRAGGSVGFRFNPSITVSANGGWRQFHTNGGTERSLSSGAYAGLGLLYNFQAGPSSPGEGIGIAFTQDGGVYPAIFSLYRENPAAAVRIQNNENAEIRDVRVSFRAGAYTASEFPCGQLPLLARGKSAELPLYADFSPGILRFTDTGRVLGEIVIRYLLVGKEKQSVRTVQVEVLNRNRYPPGDDTALAAFVSPNSEEVLEFARYISGLARSGSRAALNRNMQAAIWLLEGLRAAGMRLDDEYEKPGELQFPAETLGYKSGGAADMGLLYAAMLTATGIPAGFVRLTDDFIVMCNLGINARLASSLFDDLDRLLFIDDETWLPLSMRASGGGFMDAWDNAMRELNECVANNLPLALIFLDGAWGVYPPAQLPAMGLRYPPIDEETLSRAADEALRAYIERDISPRLRRIQTQLSSNPSAAVYNQLGLAQLRMGRTAEARAAYERAANMGSVAGMNNRGNLALVEKDYDAAERWFRMALARDAENAIALRGLERASSYRDNQ